jgi:hypothetical protein
MRIRFSGLPAVESFRSVNMMARKAGSSWARPPLPLPRKRGRFYPATLAWVVSYRSIWVVNSGVWELGAGYVRSARSVERLARTKSPSRMVSLR